MTRKDFGEARRVIMRSFGARRWEDLPADVRIRVGTLSEREAEARRQGIMETWETRARRGKGG